MFIGTIEGLLKLRDEFTGTLERASASLATHGRQMEATGRKMAAVGSQMSLSITAPLAAMGGFLVKTASDFESSFAGIRKTVNATEQEFATLERGMRGISKQAPLNVNDLNRIGEAAGQLGIQVPNILSFTDTIAKIGVTTNLTVDAAATGFARFANITGLPQQNIDRLGATVVDLGNNFATTEAEILEFGLRMAGAGEIAGFTEAQILGIGAALSSVGVEAEAGGTAVQKVMLTMAQAVATGSSELAVFAKTAGMSARDFAAAFTEDAGAAFLKFVEGLGEQGIAAAVTLEQLNLQDQRLIKAFLSLGAAGDLLSRSMGVATKAFAENTALAAEAEKRFATFASQVIILWNKIKDLAITIGTSLMPTIRDFIKFLDPAFVFAEKLAQAIAGLPAPARATALAMAAIVAAAGPVVVVVGALVAAFGAVAAAAPAIVSAIGAIIGPLGLAVAAIAAVAVAFVKLKDVEVEFAGHTTSVSNAVRATLSVLGEWFTLVGGVIFDALKEAGGYVARFGSAVIDTLGAMVGATGGIMKEWGKLLLSTVKGALNDVIRVSKAGAAALERVMEGDFVGAFEAARDSLRRTASEDFVGDFVANAIEAPKELIEQFKEDFALALAEIEQRQEEAKKQAEKLGGALVDLGGDASVAATGISQLGEELKELPIHDVDFQTILGGAAFDASAQVKEALREINRELEENRAKVDAIAQGWRDGVIISMDEARKVAQAMGVDINEVLKKLGMTGTMTLSTGFDPKILAKLDERLLQGRITQDQYNAAIKQGEQAMRDLVRATSVAADNLVATGQLMQQIGGMVGGTAGSVISLAGGMVQQGVQASQASAAGNTWMAALGWIGIIVAAVDAYISHQENLRQRQTSGVIGSGGMGSNMDLGFGGTGFGAKTGLHGLGGNLMIGQLTEQAEQMQEAFDELVRITGLSLERMGQVQINIKGNGRFWVRVYDEMGDFISREFASMEEARDWALKMAFVSSEFAGATEEVAQLLKAASRADMTFQEVFEVAQLLRDLQDVHLDPTTRAMRELWDHFGRMRDRLAELGISTKLVDAAMGKALQDLRDQILGIVITPEEELRRSVAAFNAEIEMRRAELEMRLAELMIKRDELAAQGTLLNAQGQMSASRIKLWGAEAQAQGAMVQAQGAMVQAQAGLAGQAAAIAGGLANVVGALAIGPSQGNEVPGQHGPSPGAGGGAPPTGHGPGQLSAIDALIASIMNMLANLPKLITDAELAAAMGRLGGRGGGRGGTPRWQQREDIMGEVAAFGPQLTAAQQVNQWLADFTERIEAAGFTTEQAADLMAQATAEAERRIGELRDTLLKSVADFANIDKTGGLGAGFQAVKDQANELRAALDEALRDGVINAEQFALAMNDIAAAEQARLDAIGREGLASLFEAMAARLGDTKEAEDLLARAAQIRYQLELAQMRAQIDMLHSMGYLSDALAAHLHNLVNTMPGPAGAPPPPPGANDDTRPDGWIRHYQGHRWQWDAGAHTWIYLGPINPPPPPTQDDPAPPPGSSQPPPFTLQDFIDQFVLGGQQQTYQSQLAQLMDAFADLTPAVQQSAAGQAALADAIEALQERYLGQLREWHSSLNGLGELAPMTLRQRYDAAIAEYQRLLASVNAGNLDDVPALQAAAQQYIMLAGQMFGTSTGGYAGVFNQVWSQIADLLGVTGPAPWGGASPGGIATSGGGISINGPRGVLGTNSDGGIRNFTTGIDNVASAVEETSTRQERLLERIAVALESRGNAVSADSAADSYVGIGWGRGKEASLSRG